MEVLLIPTESISVSPDNPRDVRELDSAFSRSVTARGVLTPIRVRPVADHYEVIDGHRRLQAALAAQLPTVPVLIDHMTQDRLIRLADMFVLNVHRRDLTPGEKALNLGYLIEEMKQDHVIDDETTQRELSGLIGISQGEISKLLKAVEKPAPEPPGDENSPRVAAAIHQCEDLLPKIRRYLRDGEVLHAIDMLRRAVHELEDALPGFDTEQKFTAMLKTKNGRIFINCSQCGTIGFNTNAVTAEERARVHLRDEHAVNAMEDAVVMLG